MISKAVHIFSDMLLIFSSIGILLSALFASTTLLENNFIINRLNNSWNKSPITRAELKKDQLCIETDINLFSINNYLWPGNYPGCDCTKIGPNAFKSRKYKGNYYQGKCEHNQTLAGCSAIMETQSFPLHKWRGKYFCHRALNEGYFGLITVRKGEACPEYYKTCGKIDTLENELCIRSVEDCPLNHLSIVHESDILKLDTSNTNTESFILTEFHVTDGENVCINNEQNLFSELSYKLFSRKSLRQRSGCKSVVSNNNSQVNYDLRFKQIDSYSKRLFYEHNGLYIVDILPHFLNFTNEHTIKLFAAPYIGWNKNCMHIGKNSILEEFGKLRQHLKNIEDNNKSLIFATTAILLYIGIVIFCLKYKYSEIIDNDNLTIPDWFINYFICIYLIFIALNYYVYYLVQANKNSIYLNQSNTSFFDSLFNDNCTDYETNISLKFFGKEFFSNIRWYNYMISFVIINTIFSIIICIFGIYSKKLQNKNVIHHHDDKKNL